MAAPLRPLGLGRWNGRDQNAAASTTSGIRKSCAPTCLPNCCYVVSSIGAAGALQLRVCTWSKYMRF